MKKLIAITAALVLIAVIAYKLVPLKTETPPEKRMEAAVQPKASNLESLAETNKAIRAAQVPGGSASLAPDKLVPLRIALPAEKLQGTPVPPKAPNLESVAETQRANRAVQVLEGSVNLALGKPVTSSDSAPVIGMLEQVTDGDKQGDEGYFVELADGKQWVQIDLEQKENISAVAVWHFHSQERVYHDVVIQLSNDPDFISGVTTIFNNDTTNRSGLGIGKDKAYVDTFRGRVVGVNPAVVARYVRLYSRGNTANSANHYIEVEVWGTPAK